MQTHTFIKEGHRWYIELPEYIKQGGTKADLEMVEGADTMLNIMAGKEDSISIALNEKPFDNADELYLVELCDPSVGGGYYFMPSFEGKAVQQKMWLCGVTMFVFGYMPDKIFVKRVNM